MQTSRLVRTAAAVASIVLVAAVLMGAATYVRDSVPAAPVPMVGVPTGQFVDGVEVQRLPSITVTARRSDFRDDLAR